MAHSSGGGHSGGGCHSGGGSSYHSHSRSSTTSHHIHRCSQHRFPQSHRYSYVDRNGKKHYVFCRNHPAHSDLFPWPILCALFFLICFLSRECQNWFYIPEKLENPDSRIVIEDRLQVISDPARLQEDLTRFYEKTGVTPAVLTVSEEDWVSGYGTLGAYSLEQYYRLFDDEVHWLIVYSVPEDSWSLDWAFEGIIGDHTGASINDWMCMKFTEQTYRNLSRMQDPGNAIGCSFLRLLPLRKFGFLFYNWPQLLTSAESFVFFLFPFLLNVYVLLTRRKYRDAILDE